MFLQDAISEIIVPGLLESDIARFIKTLILTGLNSWPQIR
jgi:hypothetical protein